MNWLIKASEFTACVSLFAIRVFTNVRRLFEGSQILRQIVEVGTKSIPIAQQIAGRGTIYQVRQIL